MYWAKYVDSGTSDQDTITLRNTVNAYLPCNFFDGSLPPPVIGWKKNDLIINDPKILPGSNSLLLEAFEAVNGDTYRCALLNKYGDPTSREEAITEVPT